MSALTNDDFRLLARFAEPGLHPVPAIGAELRTWLRLANARLVIAVDVNGRELAQLTELGRRQLDHWRSRPALPSDGVFGLTPLQRKTLDFIKAGTEHGQSPSFEEIRRHLGLCSKSGVARLVDGLVERGCVDRLPRRARSLKPLATALQ